MTLTTGLAPVQPTADVAVGAVREALVRPATRPPLGWLVVTLDVLAAAVAAVVGVVSAPAWELPVLALVVAAWPLAVIVAGGYSRLGADPYAVPARALLGAGAGLALLGWCVVSLVPSAVTTSDPRLLGISALVVAATAPAASIAFRCLVPLAVPRHPVRVVVVGPAREVRALLREADRGARRPSYEPVAVCLSDTTAEDGLDPTAEPWPLPARHGAEEALLDAVRFHHAEAVVAVPGQGIGPAELRRWGAWLQDLGIELSVTTGLRDVAQARLGLATMGGMGLLRVRPAALSGPGQLAKSAADRTLAAVLLLVFSPLLGVLAMLIRSDSAGPALFRQTRVGRHGRLFTVYKLRTMCLDADRRVDELAAANESDRDGVLFKIKRDPRTTRLGAVLRTYSLDELPQLLNVVRGEMSLIGPRPALPTQVQAYDDDLRRRLAVRPGMTGLWQVSGRSDLAWEDTVRLDLQYVDNWSWGLDARIALRTATAVLSHRGAY